MMEKTFYHIDLVGNISYFPYHLRQKNFRPKFPGYLIQPTMFAFAFWLNLPVYYIYDRQTDSNDKCGYGINEDIGRNRYLDQPLPEEYCNTLRIRLKCL